MQVDGEGKEGTPGPNAGGVGHITTEEAAMGTQVVVRGMRPIDAALSCCMCPDLPDDWPAPPAGAIVPADKRSASWLYLHDSSMPQGE